MYCNCREISSFWDQYAERVFPLLGEIYKGLRKRDIPMIEIIRSESPLHGYGDSNDSNQVRGGDVFFVHIATCTCKGRPLIRMTEKCLEFDDEVLSNILTQAVAKLKEDSLGEFSVSENDHTLQNFK